MTTIAQVREQIYQTLETAWGATTPITFGNEDYDPVEGQDFIRLSVQGQSSRQDTLGQPGQRKYFRLGTIFVQIFVPENSGMAQTDAYAQTIVEAFEGARALSNDLRFQAAIVREIGPTDGYNMTIVEIPFDYTERR